MRWIPAAALAAAWLGLWQPLSARPPEVGAPSPQRCEFVEPHMGTLFRIVLYADDPATAGPAARAAFERIAALNRIFSDYEPESEVMRLCRAAPETPVPVSHELFSLLHQSLALAELTDGAFDVTLGPVNRLWREARRSRVLPTDAARTRALSVCGRRFVHLDSIQRTATLRRAGMLLDFGGIAKGFAADEALRLLEEKGFPRALVAASGDLALGDPPPGKDGWTIELAPFGRPRDDALVLTLDRVGVSTSGDTEQFVEIDGVRYSHVVDPATGWGLTRRQAVTTVARSAALSDAWATACSVLDLSAGSPLGERASGLLRVIVHTPGEGAPVSRTVFDSPPIPTS